MIIEVGFFGNFLSLSCTGPSTTHPSKTTSLLPLNKALQGQSTRPVLIKKRFSYFFLRPKTAYAFSKDCHIIEHICFCYGKASMYIVQKNNNCVDKVKLCNSNALMICKNWNKYGITFHQEAVLQMCPFFKDLNINK